MPHPRPVLTVWPLPGLPEITPGTDLVDVIARAAGDGLESGDILVVTSKIVSKAEDRFVVADDREEAITSETVRVVASRTSPTGHTTRIVQNRLGIVSAAAGVDASNTPEGTVLLLPVDPDASARSIAAGLRERLGVEVGVIVSDTLGRAWRDGQTDHAIGAGGVRVELRDAIALLGELTDRPAVTAPGSAPAGEMAHTYADTTRAVALLGWRPKTSLADGLREEVRWIEAMERTGELDAA